MNEAYQVEIEGKPQFNSMKEATKFVSNMIEKHGFHNVRIVKISHKIDKKED